jgi:hypothetical protein
VLTVLPLMLSCRAMDLPFCAAETTNSTCPRDPQVRATKIGAINEREISSGRRVP